MELMAPIYNNLDIFPPLRTLYDYLIPGTIFPECLFYYQQV